MSYQTNWNWFKSKLWENFFLKNHYNFEPCKLGLRYLCIVSIKNLLVLISLIYNRTPDNQDFWIKFRYIFRLDQWKPRQRFGGSLSIFSEDVDVKWLVHHHGHGVDCIGWISLVHLTSKKSWAVSKIQGVDDPARTKTMRWDYSIFAKILELSAKYNSDNF